MRRTWHRIRWRDNPGQFLLPRLLLLSVLSGIVMLQFPALRPSPAWLGDRTQASTQPPQTPVMTRDTRPASVLPQAAAGTAPEDTGDRIADAPARPAGPGIAVTPSPAPLMRAETEAIADAESESESGSGSGSGELAATAPEADESGTAPPARPTSSPAPSARATPAPRFRPTANVNLRSGPGTRFLRLALLTPESRLRLLGQTEGDWVMVTDGRNEGWIYRPLITPE